MSQVTKCDICGVTDDKWDPFKEVHTFRITVKRRWYSRSEFEEVDVCQDCLRALRNKRKEQ